MYMKRLRLIMKKACGRSCRWWSYDMDGAYCEHEKSYELAPGFGLDTNAMSQGLCDNENFQLWEPAEGIN